MLVLPPPPPPVQCIEVRDAAKAGVKTYVAANGDPDRIDIWLHEVLYHLPWVLEDDTRSGTGRFVRLRAKGALPSRDIAALIHSGERYRLSVTIEMEPPLCEAEEE